MPRKPIGAKPMTAAERQHRRREIVKAQDAPMTKAEREDLQRLVRYREKILKSAARQRSAELLADFEQQCASIYSFDKDEVWAAAVAFADAAVAEASRRIADHSRELGIPPEFAPDVYMGWRGRGQNGSKERRAELRKVAQTRIEALEAAAIVKIELHSAETLSRIIAHGLSSTAAKAFHESLPGIETLMPTVDVTAVAGMLESRKNRRALGDYSTDYGDG
jgi:hypothetical protein